MARYTFICEHLEYDMFRGVENGVASKHTTEFNADDLTTMLENFELFLRGAGFQFDGVLDVVKPEDEEEIDFEIEDPYIMSHLVNDILNPPKFNATGLTGQNAN